MSTTDAHIDDSKDRAEIAAETGFTGTFAGFLAWLEESLVYGGIRHEMTEPDRWDRRHVKVGTVTGGYSSDERLLHHVERSLMVRSFWVESHRGGGTTYEFPEAFLTSDEEHTWVKPATNVFETSWRVRTVRVYAEDGSFVELSYGNSHAAELSFEEPDRDVMNPAGVLSIRPLTKDQAIANL
jgi:hypothetical protein